MRLGWLRVRRAAVVLVLVAVPAVLSAQTPAPLTLDEAVRLALAHAPRLEAAREAVAQATGGVREARALWWPRLSVEGMLFRFEEPMIVAPLHAIDLTRPPRFDETLIQSNVILGYTLFDGGLRAGRVRQARALEAAAGSRAKATEQAVVATTVRAFAEVLSGRAALEAEERRIAALGAEATRVGQHLREGRAARVEQLRVEAALARARADSAGAAARLDVAEAALARLSDLGRDRTAASALAPLRLTAASVLPRAELDQAARAASPTLEAATRRLAAAEAALQAARADWLPTLRLEGRAVSYGADDGNFSTEWQAGLRLAYPLFTGGSRSGAIRRARAGVREAEADLRDAQEVVDGQLDQALARVIESRRRVEALEAALAHLIEVVRSEALALSEGAGVQSDYLRAEAELAAVRGDLSAAHAAEIVAHVEVARLTGRLGRETLGGIVESWR